LALKAGADFVAVRVERLGPARFRISAEGPFVPPTDAVDDQTRAEAMMTAFNQTLEGWIRERPAEWLCGQRFFPKALVKALQRPEPPAEPTAHEIPDAP
jgi:KDO2-lipid IV(A) lauroyltransferase